MRVDADESMTMVKSDSVMRCKKVEGVEYK